MVLTFGLVAIDFCYAAVAVADFDKSVAWWTFENESSTEIDFLCAAKLGSRDSTPTGTDSSPTEDEEPTPNRWNWKRPTRRRCS